MAFTAKTDAETPVNLSQHNYFNLAGSKSTNILDHVVCLHANRFLPVNKNLIPTGEIQPVENTVFDFREPVSMESRRSLQNPQIQLTNGYDHCWVLENSAAIAAKVLHPGTGRILEIETNMPGIQFYTGNMLDGSLTGRYGRRFSKHSALALETEFFPDAPNQPNFPSTILKPGEVWEHFTKWKFSVNRLL